jgi:hypothetical protein
VENIMEEMIDDSLVKGAAYGQASACALEVASKWGRLRDDHLMKIYILQDCILIHSIYSKEATPTGEHGEYTCKCPGISKTKGRFLEKDYNRYLNQIGLSLSSI